MNKSLTWSKDGCWGIDGVDLSTLPPRVYGALCKLHAMEKLLEEIHNPDSPDYVAELAKEELCRM